MNRQSISLRLQPRALDRMRDEATRRGVTLSDLVDEYALGRPQRASSETAVAMRPTVEIGYRIGRAVGVLERLPASPSIDEAIAYLRDARHAVAEALQAAMPAFHAEIADTTGARDRWSG